MIDFNTDEQPPPSEVREYLIGLGFEVSVYDLAFDEDSESFRAALRSSPVKQAFILFGVPKPGMYSLVSTSDIPVKLHPSSFPASLNPKDLA